MLFQRIAKCLIEENKKKKFRIMDFSGKPTRKFRTPGDCIMAGIILWELYLVLCWCLFSPYSYTNSIGNIIVISVWFVLLIFSVCLSFSINKRFRQGVLNTGPEILSDGMIKLLTYLIAIIPIYLFFIICAVLLICFVFGIIM